MVRQTHDLTENKLLLEKHAVFETMMERLRADEEVLEDELNDVKIVHFANLIIFTFSVFIGLTFLFFFCLAIGFHDRCRKVFSGQNSFNER